MEDRHFDHQILLSMNFSCCELCPGKLKNKLLNMRGVESVVIDIEKNLVVVTGTVEPMTLLNRVAEFGKRVQLLPNNGESGYQESHCGSHRCEPYERFVNNEEEEPHRCEPYHPPLIDEGASRDFFSKIQYPRMVDSVSGDHGSFFGGGPFSGHGGGGGFGPPYMPQRIMPPHFGGYHQPPPQYGPPRPFGGGFNQF